VSDENAPMGARKTVSLNVEGIPQELKNVAHWVVYKRPPEGGKLPFDANELLLEDKIAAIDNPSTWTTFEKALAYYNAHKDYEDCNGNTVLGLGFAITEDLFLIFLDIDCHIDGVEEKEKELLQMKFRSMASVAERFETYGELSVSGYGYHFYARGSLDSSVRQGKSNLMPIELYSKDKFAIITGNRINDYDISAEERTIGGIQNLQRAYFEKNIQTDLEQGNRPLVPQRTTLLLSDEEVIKVALKNQRFNLLWNNRWEEVIRSNGQHYSTQHFADFALMGFLIYYTGNNKEQAIRLFHQSPCYKAYGQNGKWSKYEKDILNDAEKASKSCRAVYTPPKRVRDAEGLQDILNTMKI